MEQQALAQPASPLMRRLQEFFRKLRSKPVIYFALLGSGAFDMLVPSPVTAAPLYRVLDLSGNKSKKKRGWAYLSLFWGLLKVHSAFSEPPVAAKMAGWAFLWQGVTNTMEGFYHKSIPRADKDLAPYIAFNLFMFVWLQVHRYLNRDSNRPPLADALAPEAGQHLATAPPLD
mmetsp:Transcript_53811/g.114906  ORF Transcript_53811/g.114906 Transcript_53811/m.114906 type:complete len:173 (+) Transcript_53811:126-644(+)